MRTFSYIVIYICEVGQYSCLPTDTIAMTPPIITPLKQPIAIRPEYIAQRNGSLLFRNNLWSTSFNITDQTDGFPCQLFTTKEKFWGGHWILRQNIVGPVLLELRRKTWSWSSKYYVLLPGMLQDAAAVQLHHRFSWSARYKIDVIVLNLAAPFGDAEAVRLRIEGQSWRNMRLNVYLCDSSVLAMTAKRVMRPFRDDWWVDVAEGFDLSLVS